VNNNKSPKRN